MLHCNTFCTKKFSSVPSSLNSNVILCFQVLGQNFRNENWGCIQPWSTGDLELFPKDLCNFLLWTVEKSGEKFSGTF